MPALSLNLHPRMMAVPNASERPKNHHGRCSRTCTIALATIIPIVFIALTLSIAFLVWGKPYLQRRRRAREEEEARRNKLGDEESVTGNSDVSSLDGEVLRRGEERREEMGREMRREETRRETRRVEEGHEHDHILAMITARP
ncbi:MAG: hypothetical protein Q9225_002949 [Loekoesia sp. 1 TL-2023]